MGLGDWSEPTCCDAGVRESKLHIVPIAVNTTRYDPRKTLPFKLPKGQLIFGRHRRELSQVRGEASRVHQLLPLR